MLTASHTMTAPRPVALANGRAAVLRLRRYGRPGKIENAGEGGCDGSAVGWQVFGGPVCCQFEEVGQVAFGISEQPAKLGVGQFDQRAVALFGVDGEPDCVARTLRNR